MVKNNYDKRVIGTMIGIYCNAHHKTAWLCDACAELLRYASARVDSCPLGEKKTTCKKCPIHCYDPIHREQIRQVMRYAGPRLLFIHPIMALRHILK